MPSWNEAICIPESHDNTIHLSNTVTQVRKKLDTNFIITFIWYKIAIYTFLQLCPMPKYHQWNRNLLTWRGTKKQTSKLVASFETDLPQVDCKNAKASKRFLRQQKWGTKSRIDLWTPPAEYWIQIAYCWRKKNWMWHIYSASDKPPTQRWEENWSIKNGTRQANKVRFPPDHLIT